MIKNGRHFMGAKQFYAFYQHHRSILPAEPFLSNYKVKRRLNAIEELHQEYLSYLLRDKDDCHFRDYLHLTGNIELIPMVEMMNQRGVTLSHLPGSSFSFNKREVLTGVSEEEDKLSYVEWKRLQHKYHHHVPIEEIAGLK